MSDYSDDYQQPVTPETLAANRRHDAEKHTVCMDPRVRLHSRFLQTAVQGRLTDKKIDQYAEKGYYSAEFRQARREFWDRRAKKREKRDGNFLILSDGRKVFSPM